MYEENINHERQELVLNEKIKSDLQPTAKWAKIYFYFLCVTIVLAILGLPVLLFSPEFIKENVPNVPIEGLGFVRVFSIFFLFVLISIIIYFASRVKRFADSMKEVCVTGSSSEAQRGFAAMKSFFRFNGILCIILISLIVVPLFLFMFPLVIVAVARL